MRGFTEGAVSRRGEDTFCVRLWHQPTWRWLIAEIYWLWARVSFKPMRYIETWHKDLTYWSAYQWQRRIKKLDRKQMTAWRRDWLDRFVPLTNRQELRDDWLANKGRVVFAVLNANEEQYRAIVAGPVKNAAPAHPMVPAAEEIAA